MGLGAIVVLGADGDARFLTIPQDSDQTLRHPAPCVDVLGRSMIERSIDQLLGSDVDVVTVLAPPVMFRETQLLARRGKVKVHLANNILSALVQTVSDYSQNGIDHSFIVSASVYVETDLRDFFYFHREARRPATCAAYRDAPLEMWIVDCLMASRLNLERLLTTARKASSYLIGGYGCGLQNPRDLRTLITDALSGRCRMRPSGEEVRPGIWIDEEADVDRRARIVAPAYIGRRSKVRDDVLVTRSSSIERDCSIDYGTVIEDSSILSNTSIGIWLDVRHAVADGNKLLSLAHDVTLEISDPSVMQSTVPVLEKTPYAASPEPQSEPQPLIAVQHETTPVRKAWQLEPILFRGE